MKRLMVRVLAVFAVLMMVGTSAWAFDDMQHVKSAPNGQGDLLIFPFYYAANGGWQTRVTVVNTSTTWSVIAKVVFKSHFYSEELLDFFLYLTPADVWVGTITNDGTNTYVESTDDSAMSANGQFASATNPMKVALPNPTCIASRQSTVFATDSNNYGYFEVIEAWYGDTRDAAYDAFWVTGESRTRPVSKSMLARIYNTTTAAEPPTGFPKVNVASQDRTINVLSGYLEFQNALMSGYTSSMRATAFADFDVTVKLRSTDTNGVGLTQSRNTMGELEAALTKADVAMPYVHQGSDFTVHIMSFPTKVSNWNRDTTQNFCRYIETRANFPAFWDDPTVPPSQFATDEFRCISYQNANFDLSERTGATGPYSGPGLPNALCEEVNILLSQTGFATQSAREIFAEGWTQYTWTLGAGHNPTPFDRRVDNLVDTHSFYGVPVIPSLLTFKKGGVTLSEGSYTDGHVYGRVIAAGTADPNATAILSNGWAVPEERPAYYDAGWAAQVAPYAVGTSWLPEYQYSNEVPELGRESY